MSADKRISRLELATRNIREIDELKNKLLALEHEKSRLNSRTQEEQNRIDTDKIRHLIAHKSADMAAYQSLLAKQSKYLHWLMRLEDRSSEETQTLANKGLITRLKFIFDHCAESQKSIADELEITPQSLSQWLKTGRASRKHLVLLSKHLGISSQWLIDGPLMPEDTSSVIGRRLRLLRNSIGLHPKDVVKAVNFFQGRIAIALKHFDPNEFTEQVLNDIETGRTPLTGKLAYILYDAYEVRNYLDMVGKVSLKEISEGVTEDPLNHKQFGVAESSTDPYVVAERSPRSYLDIPKFMRRSVSGNSPTTEDSAPRFVNIPFYSEAYLSAGPGAENGEHQEVDKLSFQQDWLDKMNLKLENLCVVRCRGDSMQPRINDEDVVLINKDFGTIQNDKIYAINYGGEAIIKRLNKKFDGSLVINSENPAYPPEEVPADQAEALRVIGRAVWHAGTL